MPQTGYCTDVTCNKELTELYECHCCSWLICLKHLLEHVEISKRDKKIQLDTIRNELISISYTLEAIVEKKIHEIELEKQLINQAKTIIDKTGHTIEEIRLISEEINQAILSNRKEETIVKVESSLSEMTNYSCNNENMKDRSDMSILFSSSASNNILQQPKSPTYRVLRSSTNGREGSSTPKRNDQSTKFDFDFDINNINDENMDPTMDVTNDEEHGQEKIIKSKLLQQCPLTFDGAFGIFKANHSIELCPISNSFRRNLIGHFTQKHKLKKTHARRLFLAIKYGENPKTTKLFNENEDIIDHDRNIPCPFSSNMINLIGCCPTQSRKIPCSYKSIPYFHLVLHLKAYHNLSLSMAQKISKSHREKLSKMLPLNGNDTISH